MQCGFVNDTRLTAWAEKGDGLVDSGSFADLYGKTRNETGKSQRVVGGCAFCGSMKWQKQRPRKLSDDQFLPASDK